MPPWKRRIIYKPPIVGFHVSFRGCIYIYTYSTLLKYPTRIYSPTHAAIIVTTRIVFHMLCYGNLHLATGILGGGSNLSLFLRHYWRCFFSFSQGGRCEFVPLEFFLGQDINRILNISWAIRPDTRTSPESKRWMRGLVTTQTQLMIQFDYKYFSKMRWNHQLLSYSLITWDAQPFPECQSPPSSH